MNRPPRHWPTGWIKRPTKRSSSSTSVVVRSTCPSLISARACSRCFRPTVTATSVATTGTRRLIDYLADEFKKTEGIDLRSDAMALQRLKEAAEKAKHELSTSQETTVNLPFITATQEGAETPADFDHPCEVRADLFGPLRPHHGPGEAGP